MMYENGMDRGGCERTALPQEDLTGMLHETHSLAVDVGNTARRIREHLFGAEPEKCTAGEAREESQPCFRDEMAEIRRRLMVSNEVLAEIFARLGVR